VATKIKNVAYSVFHILINMNMAVGLNSFIYQLK